MAQWRLWSVVFGRRLVRADSRAWPVGVRTGTGAMLRVASAHGPWVSHREGAVAYVVPMGGPVAVGVVNSAQERGSCGLRLRRASCRWRAISRMPVIILETGMTPRTLAATLSPTSRLRDHGETGWVQGSLS